jgi:branched-chain amino acid aminotransferase
MTTTITPAQKPVLQQPKFIYVNGAVRPWAEATLHVTSEGVQRGMNVFEGLKGFWQPDGRFGLLAMHRHWMRLKRSAALMHMPFDMSFEAYDAACHEITACQREPGRNMWIRTTLYLTEGHWGLGDKTDLVLAAYHYPMGPPARMATGISTWRRASDNAAPARIKSGFNYLSARFAKIEGRSRGYPEMILLNDAGRVAEFIGSGIVMVRDGTVFAPPASEGAFESITVDIIRDLCAELSIPFVMRPIQRTELIIADEIAAVGTLNDITIIGAMDERPMGPSPILTRILERYLAACEGKAPHPALDLTFDAATPARATA